MPASALAYISAEAGILLKILSAASSGNDVLYMVPELPQAILSKPTANSHLRKLAYDVCRHANLTATDYNKLWEAITSDVNSSDPDVTATALRFLVSMPASQLADRFVIGQLSELTKPCLVTEAAVVRAAAVQALSHVLLLPEVQHAAASSSGLASAYEGLWDELTDSLLDERPFVVGQAAAATAQLLACGVDSSASSFSGTCNGGATAGNSVNDTNGSSLVGFMMSRFADRAALRVSAALGPVLEMCGLVPAPGQVAVCDMLLALTRRVLTQTLRTAAAGVAAPPLPQGVPVPSLGSLVTSVASYLANQLQSGDAAARTEASGAVLELSADLAEAGPVVGTAAAGLPQGIILGAADTLIQLREREFVEAGLGDICETLAAALPALLPAGRIDMLRKLWPLIGRIDDVSRRARILSLAWKTAVTFEMEYRTRSIAQHSDGVTTNPGALPGPASTSGSDPLGILEALTGPAAAASARGGGGGTGPGQTTGVVTSLPASYRVAAMLGDPFVGAILSGKAPAAEASGSFAVAQASAASASAPSSPSLLSSVTAIKRAAPSPPPPLSLARVDSVRSAASGTTLDSGKGSKTEKDRKSVFSTRFFRKGKARVEADSDHASTAAAQEEAAAAKQEEKAAAAAAAQQAAAQQAAAPPPSPKGAPSSSGGSGPLPTGAPSGGSTGNMGTVIPARPATSHATLRHELLQCLLQQLARHPAAAAAAELCNEHVVAARHDRNPQTHTSAVSSSSTTATSLARRLGSTVQWIAMVSEVLSNSMLCVGWEPYVVPAITANPVAPPVACVPVDFNNLTADLWLGVLQAALHAARSAQALLGRMVVEAVETASAGDGGDQRSAFMGLGYGTPYGLTAGGQVTTQQQPQVTAEMYYRDLLSYLKERDEALQGLLLKFLSSWSALSASVRPRVAWVAASCLPLPGHWDDRWEVLVSSLDSLLVRGTDVLTACRRYDLLGSALAGALFKAGRQAWTDPNKPFLFDIASASALCEAAEYEALGSLVALSALQHLAARLINAVADAVPHGHAGTAHSQAVAVAKRLEAVLRHFIGTETAAAPHVRDWCKRILRYLATIMNYTPPVNLPPLVAALGVIAKQEHRADGADGANDDDDSSDASSVYQPAEGQSELPPALAAAAAAAVAAATAASTQAPNQTAANGVESNGEAAHPAGATTVDEAAKQRAASGSSYLVHSASAAVPMWGYPFAPLSAVALHNSKRARRHRALSQHLAAATVSVEVPRPPLVAAMRPLRAPEDDATIAAALPTSGPALSSRNQYRLDNEAFWMALPHAHSPWQELTGPADPLLLRGCYVRSDQAHGDAATITVMLSAVNRLPVDVSDVEVALKTSGPVLANAGKPAIWELPKLAAHDRAITSFTFQVLGYGDIHLHIRLQLCRGPPRTDSTPLQLTCMPLEVPFLVLMRPPRLLPEAADFFKSWGTLPARMELSGVCTWPGPEGGALLISALLRQPLGCALLQHVPAVCGFQAAFSADTALGDNLAIVVMTQLMPPAIPGSSSETFCTLSIRSSCPDLILCLQGGAATWLAEVTSGTASLGGAGRSMQPAACAKPPLHPRVAALLQSYNASAAQLESTLTPMVSFGLSAAAGAGQETNVRGTLNTVLLKNVAVQEWQRLQRLAV